MSELTKREEQLPVDCMIPPSLVRDAAKTAGLGEVDRCWFAKCAEAYHQQTLAQFGWQVNPVSRAICERAAKWVQEAIEAREAA